MVEWLNQNSGFVSAIIFLATLFLGWISGIFKALRRRPKFKIKILPGPTFASTFNVGKKFEEYEVHKTSLSLYLSITNIGSAPANIENIAVAYHWNITKFNFLWIRYRVFWFWLKNQAVIMEDFKYDFGENIKFYPFLFQKSIFQPPSSNGLYLREGQNSIGVVYYEQDESYGGCFPYNKGNKTKMIVQVTDSYGNKYSKKFLIPIVSLEEAKKYNPSFGETFKFLRKAQEKNEKSIS